MRVPPELRVRAAGRLVRRDRLDAERSGQEFLDAAARNGIDVGLMWATLRGDAAGEGAAGGGGECVGETCLAVRAPGRTAMLFVSGESGESVGARGSEGASPGDRGDSERAALLEAACAYLGSPTDGRPAVRLAQALLEPEERSQARAFERAGFLRLGELAYMRRTMPRRAERDPRWPADVEVVSYADLDPLCRVGVLERALGRTYERTLDCPELCGRREIADVIESHTSVGVHDPSMWWIVFAGGEAEGCALLSPCPEQGSVELVYMGISSALRGRGVGSALLGHALNRVAGRAEGYVTCAVDTRNAPALRMYRNAKFKRFATRVPLIRSLGVARGGG